jgi:hypothetical protein
VCCRIIGINPFEVPHIRLAHERGFGPLQLPSIQISGDVTLEQAQERAHNFKVGLIRVEKYFEGTNITAYAGPPPKSENTDYCWGGCPGSIEEAIEILRKFDAETDAKMPRMHVVFGNYQGGIDWKPGERVVFIGDCAQWKGRLGNELVNIENVYQPRTTLDPYTIQGEDVVDKMLKTTKIMKQAEGKVSLRLYGCPVSVAEQVQVLVSLSGVKDPAKSWEGATAYMGWKGRMLWKRLGGKKYQVAGPTQRGEAAPEMKADASSAPAGARVGAAE